MWFRAIFEITTRRTGISAKDLQRIMGFGSYETAWTWLHKLRAAMVRPNREPLGPFAQVDETLVGGKGSPNKELVLVAAEVDGVSLARPGLLPLSPRSNAFDASVIASASAKVLRKGRHRAGAISGL